MKKETDCNWVEIFWKLNKPFSFFWNFLNTHSTLLTIKFAIKTQKWRWKAFFLLAQSKTFSQSEFVRAISVRNKAWNIQCVFLRKVVLNSNTLRVFNLKKNFFANNFNFKFLLLKMNLLLSWNNFFLNSDKTWKVSKKDNLN